MNESAMDNWVKVSLDNLSFAWGEHQVLENANVDFHTNTISAIIGPSGQGKSSLLLAINRLAPEIPGARVTGTVKIALESGRVDIYRDEYYLPDLRRKVGLVFQQPNPLPVSILKNVALPLKLAGGYSRGEIEERCRRALKDVNLWDEVAGRLNDSALELSGGQQQRLCIARALVVEPEVLMLDEPTSSLDTEASALIEKLLLDLKSRCTLIVVSHYLEQVSRIADRTFRIAHRRLEPV